MTQDQWVQIVNTVALPVATLAVGAFGYACTHAAAYLQAKKKNEFIATIAGSAGRVAGEIFDKLQALPPGTDAATVKKDLLAAGAAAVKERVGAEVAKTGVSDDALAGIVAGELGKLNAASKKT